MYNDAIQQKGVNSKQFMLMWNYDHISWRAIYAINQKLATSVYSKTDNKNLKQIWNPVCKICARLQPKEIILAQ